MRTLLVIACMALVALPASATRITVDQAGGKDFETIQEGVNAAVSGDTVRVTPSADYTGPLNRDIDFHGKNIPLESDHEYGACVIIDCEGAGRGLYFHNGEDTTAVVRRILIKNGYVGERGDGGALYCNGASPLFEWCIFSDSHATGDGGGVYCADGADARFRNCEISFNTSELFGGGAYVRTSVPRFYHCTFQGNSNSNQGGGAVMCHLTSAVFRDCRFTVNTAAVGFCSDSPCVPGNNPWGEAVGTGRVGCGPCNDAVEPRSWGSIKGVYR